MIALLFQVGTLSFNLKEMYNGVARLDVDPVMRAPAQRIAECEVQVQSRIENETREIIFLILSEMHFVARVFNLEFSAHSAPSFDTPQPDMLHLVLLNLSPACKGYRRFAKMQILLFFLTEDMPDRRIC